MGICPIPAPTSFYPVTDQPARPSKIQPPALRDDILARARLLDWLDAKIHRRVVAVIAEAGYGKTTLLADFSRRTRYRTIWYQLDDDDRDVVTFIRYLLAACRLVAPELGEATASLLRDIGGLATPPDVLVETFVRELAGLSDLPTAIILDDAHVLEGTPGVQHALREIIARAPDRLTIVLSGRRRPPVALARLRTHGEVADLTTDDLRFDHAETETLFRETYRRPLDRESLAALELRTEGWVASLEMVRTAIRDRSDAEVRRFIRELSAAQGPLNDYLAEEVVGDLEPTLQAFLMRTALLVDVNTETGGAAAGVDLEAAAALATQCERLGLLSRPTGNGKRAASRFHPLVREFLVARLRREIGAAGVREVHRQIASYGETSDWRLAAHHYAEAGDASDLHRVLVASTRAIMGSAEYAHAEGLIRRYPAPDDIPWFDIVLSRRELQAGRVDEALRRAHRAVESLPDDGPDRHLALANLMSVELARGDAVAAHGIALTLSATAAGTEFGAMGRTLAALVEASAQRSVQDAVDLLEELATLQGGDDSTRFRGVTLLNLAYARLAQGEVQLALDAAAEAVDTLDPESEAELANARLIRAYAMARMGRWSDAARETDEILSHAHGGNRAEIEAEAADILSSFGDPTAAGELLQSALFTATEAPPAAAAAVRLVAAHNDVRLGAFAQASTHLSQSTECGFVPVVGASARRAVIRAHIAIARGDSDGADLAVAAVKESRERGAHYWADYAELLSALASDRTSCRKSVQRESTERPGLITQVADLVCRRLGDLDPPTLDAVRAASHVYQDRWRHALRNVIDGRNRTDQLTAGRWLEEIGTADDVARLRRLSRALGSRAPGNALGKQLSRRLAPRVYIEDQGRVQLLIGDRSVLGSELRRKVLSLVCYLVTRPGFAATRDQALDALWPDLEPELGSNSMNQTVYFLRRVFEPKYQEDLSPGYVHSDTEMIWLDPELVRCRSGQCADIIRRAGPVDESAVDQLAEIYQARFALDFTYEDWASTYRDSMHARYLELVERAISHRTGLGDHDGAIWLARRAIDVDSSAEPVELALIRLYKTVGSHAAAAEQYAHYASAQKSECGVVVPALDDL